jgi:hypothetical protein
MSAPRRRLPSDATQLPEELRAESAQRKAGFARLSREIAEVRGDIAELKALMNRLFLVQTIVIVGLVVGLQRLLQ